MYQYSVTQWLFLFYFYCFLGWCFESAYVSLSEKRWVNRGFMRGPYLPIYGSGAIMMLVVSAPFQSMANPQKLIFTYLAGCLGATILEYLTGVVMEALFKVRYWDYSDEFLNFQGHICLKSTLAWGLLTVIMTSLVHKPIAGVILSVPQSILTGVTFVLTAVIGADFSLAFKSAMDLRTVLIRMEKIREEMAHVQKRVDMIIALTNEDLLKHKEELEEKYESFRDDMERWHQHTASAKEDMEVKFAGLKELAQSRSGVYPDGMKEEIAALVEKYHLHKSDREHLLRMRDFIQRDMIRSHPTMVSKHFGESLKELQDWIRNQ